MAAPPKTVLITGCSTGGIGWAMAKSFQQRGFYVFATARDPSKAADLAELENVEVLELDVTIPTTIAQCKEIVTKRTDGSLDILVNNAGAEFNCPLLDTDIAEAKRLYDVNGVVFNQSSIDGALNMVWAGIFASSKSAVARMSETLRVELEPLGVRVVTSICGSVNTPMFSKPGGPMELPEASYYHGVQDTAWKERMDHQRQATDVNVLAGKLVQDILSGKRGVIWRGAFSPSVRWASWLNLKWLVDRLINSARGLSQVKLKHC
ncbi:hypothetical protein N7448_007446 [Penicillium atrosanguineum]|nr:hypothetical protein N7448_007446 [Penicillium atrosanguineum]